MDRKGSPSSADHRRPLGQLGERLAAEHLQRLGLTVVARNARTRYGEIDLIAFGDETLLFVEVKTRRAPGRSGSGGDGAGSGDHAHGGNRAGNDDAGARSDEQPLAWLRVRQRWRIRRAAGAWLAENAESRPKAVTIRFDAIGVVVDGAGRLLRLEHIEGAW